MNLHSETEMSAEFLLGEVANEFFERLARGDNPQVEDYAEQYPEISEQIRLTFPALELVGESLSSSKGSALRPVSDSQQGRLGDFHILGELGRGGMGVVYEAQQISLNRRVALKILPFAAMLDRRQLQRFKNEATAAAQLKHPNIVSVYSVGHERGVHYYAMEYIEGATLADLIAQQASQRHGTRDIPVEPVSTEAGTRGSAQAPQAEVGTQRLAASSTVGSIRSEERFRIAAQIGIQAAEALEHSHLLGIVHRDIKPANLLRDADGNVWVTDFGLAQVETDEGLTMTGDVLGTLRYMSPEQALGKRRAVDYRTDIYGLGVTLFELLTLRPAFPQSDRATLLRQVSEEEPPSPRRLDPTIPRDLETVVLKAMSKEPGQRYGSAQEMADDLRRFLEDRPILAQRPTVLKRVSKWSQRHRTIIAAVTGATIVCLILAFGLLWQERNRSESARIQSDEARVESQETVRLALTVLDEVYLDMLGERMARGQDVSKQDRDLLNRGLEFYQAFVGRAGDRPELRLDMAKAYRQVGLIHESLGNQESAEHALRSACRLLEELRDESPDDRQHLFLWALALSSLAENQARMGHNDEAQRVGLQAIEILDRLHELDPTQPRYTMALAATHNGFGRMLTRILAPHEIEARHRVAIELFEQLARDSGESALQEPVPNDEPDVGSTVSQMLFERSLAVARDQLPLAYQDPIDGLAHSRLNLALVVRDDHVKHELLRSAWEHFDRKVKVTPGSIWHRKQLATANMALNDEEHLHHAVAIWDQLQQELPGVPNYRYSMARASDRLGIKLRGNGKLQDAEQYHRRAVVQMTALVQEFPEVLDYHSGLAAALNNLMTLPRNVVDIREARKLIEAAIEHERVALQGNSRDRQYRFYLAQHYHNLADVLFELGLTPKATQAMQQRIEVLQGLAEEVPGEFQRKLLHTKLKLADRLPAPQADRAAQLYLETIRGWRELHDPARPNPQDSSWLGASLNNLALLLSDRDELDEARSHYKEAVEMQLAALQANPSDGQARDFLSKHYSGLGTVYERQGDAAQAEQWWAKILSIYPDPVQIPGPGVRATVARMLATSDKYRDIETALALVNKYVDEEPDSAEAWDLCALVRHEAAKQAGSDRASLLAAAKAYRQESTLHASFDNTSEAQRALVQCTTIVEDLVSQFPAVSVYRHELAESYLLGGPLHWRSGRTAEACDALRRAFQLWQNLSAEFPEDECYRKKLTQVTPPTVSISDVTIREDGAEPFVNAGEGGLDSPRGIVLDGDGRLYVASSANHSVLRYDGTTGAFIDVFVAARSGGLAEPIGLTFGPDGHLYVSSGSSDEVLRYDGADGSFLDAFVSAGDGGLDRPAHLLFGPDGQLYVVSFRTNQVLRYDGKSGSFLNTFIGDDPATPAIDESGGIARPTGFAFGSEGDFYLAGRRSNNVLRYDAATGAFLDTFIRDGSGGLDGPADLLFGDDGYLYVSSSRGHQLLRYDAATGAFAEPLLANGIGSFARPNALTLDASGNLLISSTSRDQVLRLRHAVVSLSSAGILPLAVDVATAPDSAVAGHDFTVVRDTLTFAPGETAKKLFVAATDDIQHEDVETFFVTLDNLTGYASIADDQGVVTITDDDAARQITISDATVREGDDTPHHRGPFVAGRPGVNFSSLVFGPDGNLYADPVGDRHHTIKRFDGTTGAFIDTFTDNTGLDQKIIGIRDIVFHPTDGKLYVASSQRNEVLRYDAVTGDVVDVFVTARSGGIASPNGMAFGPDVNRDGKPELYVTGWQSHNVVRYDGATGKPLGTYITPGRAGLRDPVGLTFHGESIYVTSAGTNQILKYDAATGAPQGAAASGGLNYPRDVTFGPDGLMYVTSNNHRILRFTAAGTYVDDFVPAGTGGMDNPRSLVFKDGDLYVTATGNREILRFGTESEAVFKLTLSTPSNLPVTVDYSTADETATAGSDYTSAAGTITFEPGVTTQTILVPTYKDEVEEAAESLLVNLTGAKGAVIRDHQGQATISD